MNSEYLTSILGKLADENLALFIGAGMSTLSELPDGWTLTNNIKAKFPKIDQTNDDFMEICDDVVYTPPYNKQELIDFIKSELSTFRPSKYHLMLTKYNWSTIFTTNFDNVIEVAYNISGDKVKYCNPVIVNMPTVNLNDRKKVNLFKIMGCINASTEDGEMVLSKSDFHLAIQKRNHYLKLLSDIVKNGTILYLGYSFKDKIVTDIIKDLHRIHGSDKMPWSYWLSREEIPNDEKTKYFYSSHKIIPIQFTIEQFFEYLESNLTDEHKDSKSKTSDIKLNIKGKTVNIEQDTSNLIASYFTILNEDTIVQDAGKIDEFLMGSNTSWGAFNSNWDFKREIYSDMYSKATKEIEKYEVENNKIFKVTGMPGVGKSFLLKRLAFDIYSKNNTPVFIHDTTSKFDFKAITSFLEAVNKSYDENFKIDDKIKQVKYTFIFDDAAINLREIIRLKDYLTSRGRQILFILCDRENEWQKKVSEIKYSFPETFTLNENLSDLESTSLLNYLFTNNFISNKSDYFKEKILTDYDSSFFATIYSLVHPSKKPLNEIIKDQYNGLNDLARAAFEYICCFSQFNIPINIEWLVRILDCSYQDFIDDVIKKDAAKIIFEIIDLNDNVMYCTHHRIIAQKTLEYFLPDTKLLFEKYKKIIEKVEFSNILEREFGEKFLIRNFSLNADNESYTLSQKIELFKIASINQKSRTVLHHLGLLEIEANEVIDAEIHLKESLEIKDSFELYRGESDQNILTSLGKLYSKQAISLLKTGKKVEAEEYITLANESFTDAKHGEYPNIHAYHSHAYFWFRRALDSKIDSEKIYFFSNAIEILNSAKDNINADELLPIYTLEQEIWATSGIEDKIESISELIKVNFNSANGYYLSAIYYLKQALKNQDANEKENHLKNAFRKTEKALNYFPTDDNCLQLRCKVYKEFANYDLDKYHELLFKWYINDGSDNAVLLFELGRTSFMLEYDDLSSEVFTKLQNGVGMGNNLRTRPRDPIQEDDGSNKKFYGEITDIYSRMDGFIKPTSFDTKMKIPFRPVAAKYTASRGDHISFEIAFSFRGPIAMNVIKR
ncbi:MAG: SIR2 family protein [Bacteroidetes bacterium]|nr:SIR2 family protein [Bacteroidota bacterium]